MPRTRDPESYPIAYHEIVRKCGQQGLTIRLPQAGEMPGAGELTGMQRLLKIRGHFYSFIGGLKRPGLDPKWSELSHAAAQTIVYLDKKGVALVFSNRNESWQAQAMELAGPVGTDAIPQPTAEQESLAKVLAGIVEEEPKP